MNSIELFKKHAPELLDTLYKQEATTADFDINGALVRAGASYSSLLISDMI